MLPAEKTLPVESKANVCHVPEATVVIFVRFGTFVGLRTDSSLVARPNCPRLFEPQANTVPLCITAKHEFPNWCTDLTELNLLILVGSIARLAYLPLLFTCAYTPVG